MSDSSKNILLTRGKINPDIATLFRI